MKNELGTVYLLEAEGTGNYKIGYTTLTVKERLAQLQTGCPDKLIITKSYLTTIPTILETSMHNAYRGKWRSGEWFELNIDDVNNFKPLCEKLETNIKHVMENSTYYQDMKNKRF